MGDPQTRMPPLYTHPNYTPVVAGLRELRDKPESIDPPRFYYMAGLDRWRQLNFTKFGLWNEPKGLGVDPKANPPGATGLELGKSSACRRVRLASLSPDVAKVNIGASTA